MAENYYDVLGVPPDASREEIESAYRERVLETHPDHNDDPDATEAFKRVTDAEEVLTDETERARYDRLGHEAYVRFTERFGAGGAADAGDGGGTPDEDGSSRSTHRSGTTGSTTGTAAGEGTTANGTDGRSGDDAAGSHHARQRARRQRAKRRRAGYRRSGRQRTERRDRRRRAGNGRGRSTDDGEETEPAEGTDSFRYSVHGWDEDEVSVGDERPSIDHHTAVFLSCLTVLYPVLVYSSVTAAFPLLVNAIVAACTLCLIGYLLTMPRIAVVAFGAWSLLAPAATWRLEFLDVTPVTAAVIVGGFWIPFGYALLVRRVLRP